MSPGAMGSTGIQFESAWKNCNLAATHVSTKMFSRALVFVARYQEIIICFIPVLPVKEESASLLIISSASLWQGWTTGNRALNAILLFSDRIKADLSQMIWALIMKEHGILARTISRVQSKKCFRQKFPKFATQPKAAIPFSVGPVVGIHYRYRQKLRTEISVWAISVPWNIGTTLNSS